MKLEKVWLWFFLAIVGMPIFAPAQRATGQRAGEKINWVVGPATVSLGDIANLQVPAGYRFADKANTATFMELCQNPVDGSELGVVVPPAGATKAGGTWFVVF